MDMVREDYHSKVMTQRMSRGWCTGVALSPLRGCCWVYSNPRLTPWARIVSLASRAGSAALAATQRSPRRKPRVRVSQGRRDNVIVNQKRSPLLRQEGWLRIKKMARSSFESADGVVSRESPRPLLNY